VRIFKDKARPAPIAIFSQHLFVFLLIKSGENVILILKKSGAVCAAPYQKQLPQCGNWNLALALLF